MNKYNPNIHHRRSIRLKGYDYSQAGAYFITICCEDRICRFGDIAVGAGLAPAQNGKGQPQGIAPTMILNEFGEIAYNEWIKLTERFPNFELDVFQIMPNHMHGIIVLNNVGATLAVAQNDNAQNEIKHDDDIRVGATLAVAQNDNAQNDNAQNEIKHDDDIRAHDDDIRAHDADIRAHDGDIRAHDGDIRAGASPAPTVSDIVGAYKSLVANGCLNIYKSKNVGAGLAPARFGKLWQRNYYEHIIRNDQSYQMISNYIINNPAKWNDDKFYRK
ncbi:MAG: hypothetical protein QM541_00565 [Flavobacterium sp.]|nr:hypothetical protein [Flavobacterium sp.]